MVNIKSIFFGPNEDRYCEKIFLKSDSPRTGIQALYNLLSEGTMGQPDGSI